VKNPASSTDTYPQLTIKGIGYAYSLLVLYIQGGPKNQTCLSVDNFVTINVRKACYMSKVSGCLREKAADIHSGSFK